MRQRSCFSVKHPLSRKRIISRSFVFYYYKGVIGDSEGRGSKKRVFFQDSQ